MKQQKTLFVFFQGHPEYESDTLLREYRRDIGRYFKGETDRYPSMPRSYFDCDTVNALTALRGESDLRPEWGVAAGNIKCAGRENHREYVELQRYQYL